MHDFTVQGGGRARRTVYIALGAGSLGVGLLGIIVPGLPTTVFLLLASYLFARSSPRLHRWLLAHPRLGPYLEQASRREMSLRSKLISLLAMWTGVTLSSLALAKVGLVGPIVVVSLGVMGTGFLLFYMRTVPVGVSTYPVSTTRDDGEDGPRPGRPLGPRIP